MDLGARARLLVDAGVHELAGLGAAAFLAAADALAAGAPADEAGDPVEEVLAVSPDAVPVAELVPLLRRAGRPGFVVADMTDVAEFTAIEGAEPPTAPLYALRDVTRGDELRGRSPDEALPLLRAAGRSPLTLAEGVCWLLQEPERLQPNHCFMTIGSRRRTARGLDARTPALWISGGTGRDGRERRGAPKAGWCWAGNRHDWLGFASTAGRRG